MPPLVTISEASRATGVSRTQIYRLRDRGALLGWVHRDGKGRPLIELEGLREHLCSWSRCRVDSFHGRPAPVVLTDDGLQPPVDDVAAWANGLLAEGWGAPPWDGTQWASLLAVWDEASELAMQHGAFDPALLEAED